MGIVTFDPTSFKSRYPEFSTLTDPVLSAYFSEATLYLNNTDSSPIMDVGQRAVLLNMIVAHIAALNSGTNGNAAPETVGRIDQATEGSVSVHLDMGTTTNAEAWWKQTKYGAAYWAASRSYRSMRYYPGRSRPQRWRR